MTVKSIFLFTYKSYFDIVHYNAVFDRVAQRYIKIPINKKDISLPRE